MTRHSSWGAEWNVFDIEKSFIKPKTKYAYVPPYIYLFILLILIGIGIGLYFLLRKNDDRFSVGGVQSNNCPKINKDVKLKHISNLSLFLDKIKIAYNNISGNGVMISMSYYMMNKCITMDGSASILRKDASWRLFIHSDTQFGFIWDPDDNITVAQCTYSQDGGTTLRETNDKVDRCSAKGEYLPNGLPKPILCYGNTSCITQILTEDFNASCTYDKKCDNANEVVIMRYTGSGFPPLLPYIKDIVTKTTQNIPRKLPSGLVFIYNSKYIVNNIRNNAKIIKDSRNVIDIYVSTFEPTTPVVIMMVDKNNINGVTIKASSPTFEDIIQIGNLINYFTPKN